MALVVKQSDYDQFVKAYGERWAKAHLVLAPKPLRTENPYLPGGCGVNGKV